MLCLLRGSLVLIVVFQFECSSIESTRVLIDARIDVQYFEPRAPVLLMANFGRLVLPFSVRASLRLMSRAEPHRIARIAFNKLISSIPFDHNSCGISIYN